MTQNSPNKVNKALYLLILLPVFMFGIMGGVLGLIDDNLSLATGFLWGITIGFVLCVVMLVGMFGWEWIKKEAGEGKLRPYMLCGLVAAIAVSGWFAWGLGDPTCIESTDPDGRPTTCLEYANDGFEATSEQRWGEFWNKLPITATLLILIAYIVYIQTEKNRPKHFKSEQDGFEVSIFPQIISINLDEDGNSYKYSPSFGPKYTIDVIQLENFPIGQLEALKVVETWHNQIVSAATGIPFDKVEYSEGEKQNTQYLFGSYQLKKGIKYYHLTMEKYGKIYCLSMYISPNENEENTVVDNIFFEFVRSFRFA